MTQVEASTRSEGKGKQWLAAKQRETTLLRSLAKDQDALTNMLPRRHICCRPWPCRNCCHRPAAMVDPSIPA